MCLSTSTFSKRRRLGLALCLMFAFALDFGGVYAATVPVPAGNMTAARWRGLINDAGNNGTLTLPRGTVTATQTLPINRVGIRVIGRGAGVSIVAGRGNLSQIFSIEANNVQLRSMQIRGVTRPRLTNLRLNGSSFLQDRPNLAAGVNRAILNRRNRDNLRILDCFIRDVNVGVEYERNSLPHGLIVRRTDFSCASGMIICTASRTAGPNDQQGNRMRTRMQLEALQHTNRAREIMDRNRNMGIRGLVFDFGNNAARRALPAVNMRGSEIWDCDFIRTSKWNLDINRGSNCIIRDNTFRGGGWANTSLNHTLHFEDAGNTRSPIIIRNNDINQMRRSSGNGLISPPAAHVWTGVTNANNAPALALNNNNYGGTVGTSLRLIKRAAGQDAQQLSRTAQVPHTVGNDVPANQRQRRRGTAALRR